MVCMKSLARLDVWWPSLDHDVEQTVRDCHGCQVNRCRVQRKSNNPWIWPTRPWQRIHVDFAGPCSGSKIKVVYQRSLSSGNGPQSRKWKTSLSQIECVIAYACLNYHPASNGEVERAVRTFKESMKTIKDEPRTLADKLACFLLSYRTTPHAAIGCTPAEVLTGHRIRNRLDILHPDLSARMSKKTKPSSK